MNLTLQVWRQKSRDAEGGFVEYKADGISPDASFLEMLDVVNERLTEKGEEPIHFEHDCREGICGSCGMMINGTAHGPMGGTATCQLHMRHFHDGETVVVEPWRARAFPVLKDLIVDRSPLDKIIQAGGYISAHTGSAVEPNSIPIPKPVQELAMDAAECIQCGACVAQWRGPALHRRQSLPPRPPPAGPAGALRARGEDGGGDGELLRKLHPLPRMRSGLPQGDLGRLHLPDEPRLPDREDEIAVVGASERRSERRHAAGAVRWLQPAGLAFRSRTWRPSVEGRPAARHRPETFHGRLSDLEREVADLPRKVDGLHA